MTAPSRVLTASRTLTAVKGKALYHDGIDDYVNCGSDSSLDITSQITIEVLVKAPAQDYKSLVDKYWCNPWCFELHNREYNPSTFYAMIYFENAGTQEFYGPDNAYIPNTWNHAVLTYDGQNVRMYNNGVNVYTSSDIVDTIAYHPGRTTYIGQTGDGERHLNGTIALVRIYERALSAAEVLYNKEHPYNPILHGCVLWLGHDSIDEGAGMWYDKTSYGNDGVIYGATAVEMNKLAGRVLSV